MLNPEIKNNLYHNILDIIENNDTKAATIEILQLIDMVMEELEANAVSDTAAPNTTGKTSSFRRVG